jgi:hypothetical protein
LQVAAKISSGLTVEVPEGIPVISEMMLECLHFDPANRPTFQQICGRLRKLTVDSQDQFATADKSN